MQLTSDSTIKRSSIEDAGERREGFLDRLRQTFELQTSRDLSVRDAI